jgi:hypothetical protein
MFQFVIVLDQFLGMLLPRKQVLNTLIGRIPDTPIYPPHQIKHRENNLQPGLNQLRALLSLFLQQLLRHRKHRLIRQYCLQEPEYSRQQSTPDLNLHVEVFNVQTVLFIVDECVGVDVECLAGGLLRLLRLVRVTGALLGLRPRGHGGLGLRGWRVGWALLLVGGGGWLRWVLGL